MQTIFLKDYIQEPNVLTRPEFLKQLSKKVNLIGVTGTHGKTSTTALLAHIFMFNGINISYIYGGVTSFNGIGGHYGDESLPLLLETDEAGLRALAVEYEMKQSDHNIFNDFQYQQDANTVYRPFKVLRRM